jgi:hypothetical protein
MQVVLVDVLPIGHARVASLAVVPGWMCLRGRQVVRGVGVGVEVGSGNTNAQKKK